LISSEIEHQVFSSFFRTSGVGLILCAEFCDSLLESMKLAFGYLHWSVMLIERSGIRGAAHARPSVLTLRNILEAMGQSVTLEFLTLPVNLSRFSICARFVCVTRLVFVFYKFRDIADNAFQCESSGFLLGKHLPDNALPHLRGCEFCLSSAGCRRQHTLRSTLHRCSRCRW